MFVHWLCWVDQTSAPLPICLTVRFHYREGTTKQCNCDAKSNGEKNQTSAGWTQLQPGVSPTSAPQKRATQEAKKINCALLGPMSLLIWNSRMSTSTNVVLPKWNLLQKWAKMSAKTGQGTELLKAVIQVPYWEKIHLQTETGVHHSPFIHVIKYMIWNFVWLLENIYRLILKIWFVWGE